MEVAGWSVRRQFDRSRLEEEFLEAVYEALLLAAPAEKTALPRLEDESIEVGQKVEMASVAA